MYAKSKQCLRNKVRRTNAEISVQQTTVTIHLTSLVVALDKYILFKRTDYHVRKDYVDFFGSLLTIILQKFSCFRVELALHLENTV